MIAGFPVTSSNIVKQDGSEVPSGTSFSDLKMVMIRREANTSKNRNRTQVIKYADNRNI